MIPESNYIEKTNKPYWYNNLLIDTSSLSPLYIRNYVFFYLSSIRTNVRLQVRTVKLFACRSLYYAHDFVVTYYSLFVDQICDRIKIDNPPVIWFSSVLRGGGNAIKKIIRKRTWSKSELSSYTSDILPDEQYEFMDYVSKLAQKNPNLVYINIP